MFVAQHLRRTHKASADLATRKKNNVGMYDSESMLNGLNALHLTALAAWEAGKSSPLAKPAVDRVSDIYSWIGYTVGWEASSSAALLRLILSSECSASRTPHLTPTLLTHKTRQRPAVVIKHGKAAGGGGELTFGDTDCSDDWSRWSRQHLQTILSSAIKKSIDARPGGTKNIFADVDFSSESDKGKLPDADTAYTPTSARALFDNSQEGKPLLPFNSSNGSMYAFFRAAVISRRAAECTYDVEASEKKTKHKASGKATKASVEVNAEGHAETSDAASGQKRHREDPSPAVTLSRISK
jgi:hypothetical protein